MNFFYRKKRSRQELKYSIELMWFELQFFMLQAVAHGLLWYKLMNSNFILYYIQVIKY